MSNIEEKTLSIIKPDAVERNLEDGIKNFFLENDLKIEDSKKIITYPCELIVNLGKVEGADVFEQINRPLKWKKK